jgi:molybdopterin synthase catalytic subunit
MTMKILIQTEPFDLNAEVEALHRGNARVGAVSAFLGVTRDVNEGREGIRAMSLEHYPGMTERALEKIVRKAMERWHLIDATVIHRVGLLAPTDPIVLVAVAAAHRQEAFSACEFIMDYLKTRAPFWKKELTPEGERWVDARSTDDQAAARWDP